VAKPTDGNPRAWVPPIPVVIPMPSGPATGRLFALDAYALIFQVFHAIPEMSSPAGLPTNALYGFTRDLLFLRLEKKPDYLVCCFDVAGPTFRDELYKEYKAHRAPMPDDLSMQVPMIRQLLEAMRVPVLGMAGYEADDLLATLARVGDERGLDVYLCTSDKDCRQLITDQVRMYNLRKHQEFNRESLKEDWGVTPEQVVDLQTLVGDSVDNVPGVPGVGVKTAAKLLQEYGTLDNLMAHLDEISKPKQRENLQAASAKLPLSRQLVRLDCHVPMKMDWDEWRLHEWDAPRLLGLFKEWGFRTFADQVRANSSVQSTEYSVSSAESVASQGELFPFGANVTGESEESDAARGSAEASAKPQVDGWRATYHLVDTDAKFAEFLMQLKKQKRFAVDLETTGLDPLRSEIVGLAFSWQDEEGWYLAVRGPAGPPTLDPDNTLNQLRPILDNPRVAKVNQNIKYDLLVLRKHDVPVRGVAGDSMVADYLLHSGERGHNLEELALRYFNHRVIPITDLIGKKAKNKPQLRMDEVATARVAEYSGEDADVAWRLCGRLEPELAACGLATLYQDLEIPLVGVLAELEYNGVRLDVPLLRRISDEMADQLEAIEQEIYDLAGRRFNIASLPQLRQVLFDELKLPVQRKTGITGAASTDQDTLEKLAPKHPLPRKILEHRSIAKLKGTYVDALPALVNPDTGRVHASFNQTVAATGRLSSSDPNLQNIPIRSELGGQIRQAFIPEEGWVLLTADYSQIELRLLAHFSGDEELRRAFAEKRDIHSAVAAQVFGVAEADVTPAMRRMAKTVNFGVIYGMSAHGLAQRLEISREEAGQFIDAYFARYPKVLEYQKRLLEKCIKTGFVCTILGRRRAITGIRPDSTYQQRNQPEREAINMEIQGSAADLIKLAMLGIYRRLNTEKLRARLLLQIHDELVLETPPDELPTVAQLVREEMLNALPLEVPLDVDVAAGPDWLEVKEINHEAHEGTRRKAKKKAEAVTS
jgi:DNA polymerase-1